VLLRELHQILHPIHAESERVRHCGALLLLGEEFVRRGAAPTDRRARFPDTRDGQPLFLAVLAMDLRELREAVPERLFLVSIMT